MPRRRPARLGRTRAARPAARLRRATLRRETLRLLFLQDLPLAHADIAARLGIAEGSVGPTRHLAAPGEGIPSTVPGGGCGSCSGTSMASPLAAGVAVRAIASGTGPDPLGFSGLRRGAAGDVAQRVEDRIGKRCGTGLRQVDACAAVADSSGLDPDGP